MPHPSQTPLNPLAEPPPVSAEMARAQRRYWRFNLALIATLMTIACGVSFGVPLMARVLAPVRFAGFRLPFYMGAQGAILVYLALIVAYIVLMERAERMLLKAARDTASQDVAPSIAQKPSR